MVGVHFQASCAGTYPAILAPISLRLRTASLCISQTYSSRNHLPSSARMIFICFRVATATPASSAYSRSSLPACPSLLSSTAHEALSHSLGCRSSLGYALLHARRLFSGLYSSFIKKGAALIVWQSFERGEQWLQNMGKPHVPTFLLH